MSLKLFIVSAFQAAIFGWMIWENTTMTTEYERLRHKNHTFNNILKDIEEAVRLYDNKKELINAVKNIIYVNKKSAGITD